MRLRIVTYNIAKGLTQLSRRHRIHDVRAALSEFDADILTLQEVQDRNDRIAHRGHAHPGQSQTDFLAELKPVREREGWLDTMTFMQSEPLYHAAYGANKHYGHGHHGNAVLSRWPIVAMENIDISRSAIERRGLLVTTVLVKQQPMVIICTHFSLLARDRLMQAQALVEHVRTHIDPALPLVIAGDFNDWHRRVDRTLRQQLGLAEAFDHSHAQPARTFPAIFPMLRLDRIYVRNLHVVAARVPDGPHWARRSDHRPILMEAQVPDRGVRTP